MNLSDKLKGRIFATVGSTADAMERECYVVGGYVRDLIIGRLSKDIDFVTVGSGIELAQAVGKALGRGTSVAVYRNYGTAQVRRGALELEFVGARKESYHRESRNPIVEDGTLDDDLARRDFTINALAISVNSATYGEVIDHYDGLGDIERRIIRTPLDPDITFSDDPLRMMRAIRFAAQLQFDIAPDTLAAIAANAERISIITIERITTELRKIMQSPQPSIGFKLLHDTGLLRLIFPELEALRGVEVLKGVGHKDNFYHTLQVLDTVALGPGQELAGNAGRPWVPSDQARVSWDAVQHHSTSGMVQSPPGCWLKPWDIGHGPESSGKAGQPVDLRRGRESPGTAGRPQGPSDRSPVPHDSWSKPRSIGHKRESPGTAGQPCRAFHTAPSLPGVQVDPVGPQTRARVARDSWSTAGPHQNRSCRGGLVDTAGPRVMA